MTTKTAAIVVLVLIGMALAASLILYPSLPERMPTHWNMNGEVNGWSGKPFGCLALPALMLIFLFFVLAGDWLSPVHFKVGAFRSAFNYLMVIVAALMFYIHGLALAAALYPNHAYGRWMVGGMFIFFAWLGNMLGKTRRNFWIGIRTPWTLASDAVWIATHRLGARVFMIMGITGAIAIALGISPVWCFALIVAGIFYPVFYSLWLSKKLELQEDRLDEGDR
jgi:uncharacterized membrane protein